MSMHKIESPPGSDTEEIVTVWPSMQDRSISFWYYGFMVGYKLQQRMATESGLTTSWISAEIADKSCYSAQDRT